MESKKDVFKVLINEAHERKPCHVIQRDLRLPDWCPTTLRELGPAEVPAPVTFISGPRWSGKTYYLFHLIESLAGRLEFSMSRKRVLYINFEDDRLLPVEASDLPLLLDAYFELYPDLSDERIAIFLDEIHNIEGWEYFVSRLIGNPNFRVFIAGPQRDADRKPLAADFLGRAVSFRLPPLSFKEFLAFKGVVLSGETPAPSERYRIRYLLDEYLIYGGFPEVALSDLSSKMRILRGYYDLLIYKDMVEDYAIRNVGLLKTLLKDLIGHIGSTVSLNACYNGLPPASRASRETVMEYASYLQQKELISLVPLFSESDKARRANPRRVFCLDNGLCHAVSFRPAGNEEGLAKNLVFQRLKNAGSDVYYWKDGGEVDLIGCGLGTLRAINVSYGRELDASASKPLLEFQRASGHRALGLEVITKDTDKVEAGVHFVPLWKWLLTDTL